MNNSAQTKRAVMLNRELLNSPSVAKELMAKRMRSVAVDGLHPSNNQRWVLYESRSAFRENHPRMPGTRLRLAMRPQRGLRLRSPNRCDWSRMRGRLCQSLL